MSVSRWQRGANQRGVYWTARLKARSNKSGPGVRGPKSNPQGFLQLAQLVELLVGEPLLLVSCRIGDILFRILDLRGNSRGVELLDRHRQFGEDGEPARRDVGKASADE